LQSLKLTVSNVQRVVQGYLNQYNGGAGMTVQLDVVSAEDMTGPPAQSYSFGVQSSDADATWVTLTLGGPNPLFRSFLRYLYLPNYCQWLYNDPTLQAACDSRGAYCGYWGALTTCAHTLTDCAAHNNVLRFGGYPGVSTQGFLSTTPV
jgi:phage-related protein